MKEVIGIFCITVAASTAFLTIMFVLAHFIIKYW